MPQPPSRVEVAAIPDDRWLSGFARGIFQAGFNWKVIAAKWPGFEAAFHGFDPDRVAHFHDADMDRLLADKGVVRNGAKLQAVIDNAVWLSGLSRDHGGLGPFFANWPDEDFVGLLALMNRDGARLGGATGPYALRSLGRQSFILSQDVTARLIAEGVVSKQPTSKRDMAAVQAAFNTWMADSGEGLTRISRVLAFSV